MRPWLSGSPRSTWTAATVIAVLMVVLAALQYRWISKASRAEQQRLRSGVEAAADGFADDLGHEVTRVLFAFQPGHERSVAERYRHWRETAVSPRLVREVFTAAPGAGGALALTRIDPAAETGTAVPWPADLLPLRERLQASGGDPAAPPSPIDPAVPAVVLPAYHRFGEPGDRGSREVIIVALDRAVLSGELFPDLAQRYFGVTRAPDYLVAVTGPGGLVYRSDPKLPAARYLSGDLAKPLFLPRHGEARRARARASLASLAQAAEPEGMRGDPHPPPQRAHPGDPPPRPRLTTPWRLVVTHRDGSLEAVVEGVRRRNLAVSLGVLALLAATLVVLAASTQRARSLARQQLEFVAGVTHELNTPLAAIRSAGQNLADGLVADPQQVRRYGALIEREGRRLTGMVSKALDLAGIQSGSKVYRPEPVALGEVVDEALADCRWAFEEKGVAVERDVPADLPSVAVDRAALRSAVKNLLDNAVKYAGAARWIGVRARAAGDGREVSLIVEDRGPGIRTEDRPHLFEPFYRGRDHASGAVHGSGLGLSLVRHAVEAHRGTVSVATGPGGSAFTIRLPAVLEAAVVRE